MHLWEIRVSIQNGLTVVTMVTQSEFVYIFAQRVLLNILKICILNKKMIKIYVLISDESVPHI